MVGRSADRSGVPDVPPKSSHIALPERWRDISLIVIDLQSDGPSSSIPRHLKGQIATMLDRPKRRIRFVECHVRDNGDRVETRVALVDGDTPVEGMVERASGEGVVPWAAAEATLEALRQAYGIEADQVSLKDVVSLDIGGQPAVATSIATIVGGERLSLFGVSRVVDDKGDAAVLAVLGATNRVFGGL